MFFKKAHADVPFVLDCSGENFPQHSFVLRARIYVQEEELKKSILLLLKSKHSYFDKGTSIGGDK
jgi:hypothetical protein